MIRERDRFMRCARSSSGHRDEDDVHQEEEHRQRDEGRRREHPRHEAVRHRLGEPRGKAHRQKVVQGEVPRHRDARSMTFTRGHRVIRRSISEAVQRKTRAKLDAKTPPGRRAAGPGKSEVSVCTSRRKSVVKRSAAKTLVHAEAGCAVMVTGRGSGCCQVTRRPDCHRAVPPRRTVNLSRAEAGSNTRMPRALPSLRERTSIDALPDADERGRGQLIAAGIPSRPMRRRQRAHQQHAVHEDDVPDAQHDEQRRDLSRLSGQPNPTRTMERTTEGTRTS